MKKLYTVTVETPPAPGRCIFSSEDQANAESFAVSFMRAMSIGPGTQARVRVELHVDGRPVPGRAVPGTELLARAEARPGRAVC